MKTNDQQVKLFTSIFEICSLASEVKVTRNFKMMLSSYGTQNLPHWYCRKWLNMISRYLWFAICITSESHVVNFWNLKPISHSYLNRFSHETRTHFRSRWISLLPPRIKQKYHRKKALVPLSDNFSFISWFHIHRDTSKPVVYGFLQK